MLCVLYRMQNRGPLHGTLAVACVCWGWKRGWVSPLGGTTLLTLCPCPSIFVTPEVEGLTPFTDEELTGLVWAHTGMSGRLD